MGRVEDALAVWHEVVAGCAGRDVPNMVDQTDRFAEALAAAKRYADAAVVAEPAFQAARQQARPKPPLAAGREPPGPGATGSGYGRLLVVKVAAFLLLIAVAGQSRLLVRRKLMARALVGPAAPHRQTRDAGGPGLGDIDARSVWLPRRLVLTEVIVAVVVLAVTALLGIATPPRPA